MSRTRLLGAVLVVVLGAAACGAAAADESGVSVAPLAVPAEPRGEPAPAIEFEYFIDGSPGTLADFAGAPVVLNFWASWCPACLAEMPAFEEMHRRHGDRIRFVGLNINDDPSEAQRLATEAGVSYPLVTSPDGSAFLAFGGIAMPTTVFLNSAGEEVGRHAGAIFADDLEAMLLDLFPGG